MQPERPLLTIAIPTFNRCRYLRQLLATLAPQLHGERRVELIISDNASPDDTPAVITEFHSSGLPLRYIRNIENIGSDRNFLQCYEAARSKYVWIMGDDDVIDPGGVAAVISYLQDQEYDLIAIRTRALTEEHKPSGKQNKGRHLVFTRAEDLACHVHVFFTFVSGMIINKDTVEAHGHRPFSELEGTGLVQLGWTFAALEHHRRSLAILDRLVAATVDNSGGYSLYKVFGPTLKQITNTRLTSPTVKRAILHGTLQKYLTYHLSHRKPGYIPEDPHFVLRQAFGGDFRYWFFAFPILCLPVPLGRAWYLLLRIINRLDRSLGSPLLRY